MKCPGQAPSPAKYLKGTSDNIKNLKSEIGSKLGF